MYKRISSIMFPLVTIVLIGTLVWGYQTNQLKNTVLIKAENQYQRSFHDLAYHVDHLHRELGNALAVNSTSQGFHRKCLINAWRIASEAQANINQLPLSSVPYDKTEQLLSRISKFSYQTAVRDLAKEPLTEKEMQTLKTLVDQSERLSEELNNIQSVVINNNLSWLDVELGNGKQINSADHTITDGFHSVNKTVSEYTEAGWGPSIMNMFDDQSFSKIKGRTFSEEEIKQKATEFLKLPSTAQIDIKQNGQQTKYETYSLVVQTPESGKVIHMDYSKQGGNLMWLMDERFVNESNITLEQARDMAEKYLKEHDFGEMRAVNYNEYGNVAYLTMVRVEDDIIIYPEKVAVNVAMDNGEIIGLQSSELSLENKDKKISPAKLTLEEAKNKLNPSFKVNEHTLAVIENELNKNVLCYQFLGSINNNNYRIFINADTGLEEKLEQLQ